MSKGNLSIAWSVLMSTQLFWSERNLNNLKEKATGSDHECTFGLLDLELRTCPDDGMLLCRRIHLPSSPPLSPAPHDDEKRPQGNCSRRPR